MAHELILRPGRCTPCSSIALAKTRSRRARSGSVANLHWADGCLYGDADPSSAAISRGSIENATMRSIDGMVSPMIRFEHAIRWSAPWCAGLPGRGGCFYTTSCISSLEFSVFRAEVLLRSIYGANRDLDARFTPRSVYFSTVRIQSPQSRLCDVRIYTGACSSSCPASHSFLALCVVLSSTTAKA